MNKLTNDRIIFTDKYQDHKNVVLLKYPLSQDEWKQILENQEKLEKIKEISNSGDTGFGVKKQLKQLMEERNGI